MDLAFIVSVSEGLHFAELELIRLFPVVAEVDLVTLDALSGTLQHQPGRVEGAVEGLALDEARPIRLVLFCKNCILGGGNTFPYLISSLLHWLNWFNVLPMMKTVKCW